jgi:hypothetical protein
MYAPPDAYPWGTECLSPSPTKACRKLTNLAGLLSFHAKLTASMPRSVFKCEGCGAHKTFLTHEGELQEKVFKPSIQKHCETCRTTTIWFLASPEQRSGGDRRQGKDRRRTDQQL